MCLKTWHFLKDILKKLKIANWPRRNIIKKEKLLCNLYDAHSAVTECYDVISTCDTYA